VHALTLLDAALERDPEDLDAMEARADALAMLIRPREALAAYEAVLTRSPRRELALVGAVQVASELRQWEQALDYARRLVAINPWIPDYHRNLAVLLAQQQRWDETQTQCQAWIRIDPMNADARIVWISCLLRNSKDDEAKVEFAKVEALKPANLSQLQIWFARQIRGEVGPPPIGGR
jgi:tetratricopeptide (TPR) repeat protein